MFGIEIIEVGIGLVFVYLVISIMCSSIVEVGVKLSSYRARHLKLAICALLNDSKRGELVNALYKHNLISGGLLNRAKDPTYIPAQDFATALTDVLMNASPNSEKFLALKEAIAGLKDEKLKKTLQGMLDESMESVVSFREKVGAWFDKGMLEASDWYKANMRYWVTIAAFLVVFLSNADTLRVARLLWNDNDLRESTVAAAQQYMASADTVFFNPNNISAADSARIDTTSLSSMLKNVERQINESSVLPIGWGTESAPWDPQWTKDARDTTLWVILKLIGLLLTLGAVNQGAPYWHKQLKGLLSLRVGGGGSDGSADSANNKTVTVVVQPANAVPADAPVSPPVEETPDTNAV